MKKLKERKPQFTEQEVVAFLLGWSKSLETYRVVQRHDQTRDLKFMNAKGEEMFMFIDKPGIVEAAIKYLVSHGAIIEAE